MSMNARNLEITRVVSRGLLPVLPHEFDELEKTWTGYNNDQRKLSLQRQEAIDQSTAGLHENTAAEAIASDLRVTEHAVDTAGQYLSRAITFGFPDTADEVTLGSIFFLEGKEDEPGFLMGTNTSKLPSEIEKMLPEDYQLVTLSSPMGKAMLGAKVGDEIVYDCPLGRQKVKVVKIAILTF